MYPAWALKVILGAQCLLLGLTAYLNYENRKLLRRVRKINDETKKMLGIPTYRDTY